MASWDMCSTQPAQPHTESLLGWVIKGKSGKKKGRVFGKGHSAFRELYITLYAQGTDLRVTVARYLDGEGRQS